jgi:hypothetical protein
LLRLTPLLFVAALSFGCSRPLDADECNQLLDHYTELLVKSTNPTITEEEVLRLQRDARAKAAGDPEFSRCSAKVSRRQWECAMKAPTADDIERCLL